MDRHLFPDSIRGGTRIPTGTGLTAQGRSLTLFKIPELPKSTGENAPRHYDAPSYQQTPPSAPHLRHSLLKQKGAAQQPAVTPHSPVYLHYNVAFNKKVFILGYHKKVFKIYVHINYFRLEFLGV